jgi:hypothetical protein
MDARIEEHAGNHSYDHDAGVRPSEFGQATHGKAIGIFFAFMPFLEGIRFRCLP